MIADPDRIEVRLYRDSHHIVMHNITQIALFRNSLSGQFRANTGSFTASLYKMMLMRINHILPCDKAGEQYP